jgi:uridylate kinase
MKISLSLGGSLLTGKSPAPTPTLDPNMFKKYAKILKDIHESGHEIMVVCGGGQPARYFIELAIKLGGDRNLQDYLGIKATHINALLLMAALGEVADQNRIYQRGSDLIYRKEGKILVGGGYKPGTSTDYRTVIFAKKMEADLIINATDVDGIYDKNPKTEPSARKIPELTFKQLEEIIVENTKQLPGDYGLFDLKAVRLASKLNIPVIFIDGRDPQEILNAINGEDSGSVVRNKI